MALTLVASPPSLRSFWPRRQRTTTTARSAGPQRFEGSTLPRGLKAPDFALTDEEGRRVRMADFRGRPTVVTFLYTTCEETCPGQAQVIKGAFAELGRDLPAVAVAVDPPRDTPSPRAEVPRRAAHAQAAALRAGQPR